jgi:hypothetical protein
LYTAGATNLSPFVVICPFQSGHGLNSFRNSPILCNKLNGQYKLSWHIMCTHMERAHGDCTNDQIRCVPAQPS